MEAAVSIHPFAPLPYLSRRLRSLSRHLDFGVNATPDDILASNCTSCAIDKDKSVYWTPPLYFQHSNGTFQKVTQVGGMLA